MICKVLISAVVWLQNFDKDGDGALNWDEFCDAVRILLQKEAPRNEERQPILKKENIRSEFDSMKDMSAINS